MPFPRAIQKSVGRTIHGIRKPIARQQIPMKYLLLPLIAAGIHNARCADIEHLKLCDVIPPLCDGWTLNTGDPGWKDTTSVKLPNQFLFTNGSAYLVFNAKGATSADMKDAVSRIRDYFKTSFPIKDCNNRNSGNAGISSSPTKPPEPYYYESARASANSDGEVITFQVRAVPLRSDLVGVSLSFSHLATQAKPIPATRH